MTVKVGDIKSFTLITGMEIMGKVEEISDHGVFIERAYAVQLHDDGEGTPIVGLAPLSPLAQLLRSDNSRAVDLYYSTILISSEVPVELVQYYKEVTGAVITPPEKTIQLVT